jgi:hypothetical protein
VSLRAHHADAVREASDVQEDRIGSLLGSECYSCGHVSSYRSGLSASTGHVSPYPRAKRGSKQSINTIIAHRTWLGGYVAT